LTYAENKGMMLIEVDDYDKYSIILHKTERGKSKRKTANIDKDFFSFIKKTLGLNKVNWPEGS